MASFQDKAEGKEYILQNPSKEYLPLGEKGDYVSCECSGFDDMFPTIDEVEVVIDGKKVVYPDHGEVCRLPFRYTMEGETLVMAVKSKQFAYSYQKRVYEEENGFIGVEYQIESLSSSPMEVLWAGHCLINAEKNGKIIVPFVEGEYFDLIFDTNKRFGLGGERLPLCKEHLTHTWQDGKSECRKYYFAEKCKEGFVAYQYPDGKRFVMHFDKEKLPYLGIWLNYGYINDYYCIGLEPAFLGYDSVENAKKYNQQKILAPKEKITFSIALGVVAL